MEDRPATLSDLKMLVKLLMRKNEETDQLNVPDELHGLGAQKPMPALPSLGEKLEESQIDQLKSILPDGLDLGPKFNTDGMSLKIGKERGSVSLKNPTIPKPFEKLMLDLGYDGSIAAEVELNVMKNGKLKIGADSRTKSINLGFEMPF